MSIFWDWYQTCFCQKKTGLIFLLFGAVFFLVFFYLKRYNNSLSFSLVPEIQSDFIEQSLPRRIIIPQASIDLEVVPQKIVDEKWNISETGASYLLGSGFPGKPGNAVIYGHNKRNLFGPIQWLKKGAEIKIETKDGQVFNYKIIETKIVSPKNVEVLSGTEDTTLTLYTCTGIFDSKRFVVVAEKI